MRDAAQLVCSLPGIVFVYQGDEIGMRDGPGHDPPYDRAGRDAHRHPMQWDATPSGGFTTGTPWLPLVDPASATSPTSATIPSRCYSLYRDLLAWRREQRASRRPFVAVRAHGYGSAEMVRDPEGSSESPAVDRC